MVNAKGKHKLVEDKYLDDNGCSELIDRYKLSKPIAYTSGDSAFRSDSSLGKMYKFFRFSKTFDETKKSSCWDLIEEDLKMLKNIHKDLNFKKPGKTVCYIQFFGFGKAIKEDMVRPDIKKIIIKQPCANCGTSSQIECDHKNDLKNDTRVLNKSTQKLSDFQPLCNHCNKTKRGAKKKMLVEGKRQPAPGFNIKFTEGNESYDKKDPNWHKGSYWGDCIAFKSKLTIK